MYYIKYYFTPRILLYNTYFLTNMGRIAEIEKSDATQKNMTEYIYVVLVFLVCW